MQSQTFILIIILSVSCSQKLIDKDSIYIKKVNLHPFLKDHDRRLLIKVNDSFIDSIDLYIDPGEGCNAYLSENSKVFILIDCNGDWFSIDKKTGKISYMGWKWKTDFTDTFVGVFKNYEEGIYYKIAKKKSEIYKFKDPIR